MQTAKGIVIERNLTFGGWLDIWLAGKKSLKDSTRKSYVEAVRLYGKPGLGHVPLDALRESHLAELYAAMAQINNAPEGGHQSEMLRRLLAARAPAPWTRPRPDGQKPGLKRKTPLSPARIHRVHRVLSSALGTAWRQKRIVHNPAPHVELPTVRKVRPLVWTAARIERWRQTGRVPGKVMVWTPELCGKFLDQAEAAQERLYPLYHLVATRGLRRAEAAGALWENTALAEGTISLLESEEEDDTGLKTESSWRTVSLDAVNVGLLGAWRLRQRQERLAAGATWVDSGRLFTQENGSPLREEYVSERFAAIARAAGLPPIRFHDLRHCAATIMLAAGVDMKVVSAELGHSRYAFTADVYAAVLPQLAQAAAEATVAMIPRRRKGA
ncbi:site-specific integrase [Sphaerisporangium sp. TRM90804]|uniref:tyrosine-type recombinase/integrase n=1 Tax=Sphaerisporangium sp. TRM90804 TaxID=3031113 RepID=UPI0024498D35|nr:site-specific integrase [Sphaerisporangium sp. TRM90804]MDH2425725.1 site-specific integrase [Sphaerisporangium sp. TRM90804]